MNDLTKGTTMQNPEWVQETDWTRVMAGDTVRLTNRDGAEVTITVYEGQRAALKDAAAWVCSPNGVVYYSDLWTLYVQAPLRPALPVLPKRPGTVIRAKDLGVVAMFSYASSGWFAVKNEPKMTDNELRKNFEGGFDVLEPVAETAKKVLDRVDGWYAEGETRTLTKYLAAIAAEFEVAS